MKGKKTKQQTQKPLAIPAAELWAPSPWEEAFSIIPNALKLAE